VKLSKDLLSIFSEPRVSIRKITLDNSMDFRPNSKSPLNIEVTYYLQGKPPIEKGFGRYIILKEGTVKLNVAMLEMHPQHEEEIFEMIYRLKAILEEKIADSEGVKSESNFEIIEEEEKANGSGEATADTKAD